jgi:two-component system, OmpR family, phosphate regulon sensor histidine kinase PhoR
MPRSLPRTLPRTQIERWLSPFGIAATYLVVGALWILVSDHIIAIVARDPQEITYLQTAKGWFFILVTAVLLYGLIWRSRNALLKSQEELRERARQLEGLRREASDERNRLRALIDTAPIGIAFYSAPDGDLVLSNQAAELVVGLERLRGLGAADSLSRPSALRPTGERYAPDELPCQRALRGETVLGTEVVFPQPSGREVHVSVSASPLRDADGQIVGSVVVFDDETPVREQERLRQEFLSAAAHELKTPVTTIKGYAQLLRRREVDEDPPRRAAMARAIDVQCDRLGQRVDELMDIVRLRTSPIELRQTTYDLGNLVADVVRRVERTNPERRVTLERADVGELVVEGDPGQVEGALISVLNSALAISPPSADVSVRLQRNGTATLAVAVLGAHVPSERQLYAFEPFFDLLPSGDVRYHGVVGLDLHLTKLAIERLGGRVSLADSESGGTTFTISLPLARQRPTA